MTKRLQDYSEPVLKAWSYYEALRRLGFAADDIFAQAHQEPVAGVLMHMFAVGLYTQGNEFVVNCGAFVTEEEAQAVCAEWGEFAGQLPDFSEPELIEVFKASEPWRTSAQFVLALRLKGFVIPNTDPTELPS